MDVRFFLLILLAIQGCNLFSGMADTSSRDIYRENVQQGNASINRGDYNSARVHYERAMKAWPPGSEARLFHAKSVLKQYGLDYEFLNGEFEKTREGGKGVPFIDSTSTIGGLDSIYFPIATAGYDLLHILRHAEDTIFLTGDSAVFLAPDGDTASDGVVSAGVAALDLGLLQAIQAMLAPIDMDGNQRIDSACGALICADTTTCPAAELQQFRNRCPRGRLSEVHRLESYKKLTASISLDSLSSADVDAKDVATNPGEINAFLDAMLAPTAGSNLNLGLVDASVKANSKGQDDFEDDLGNITSNVNDLASFLRYMRHNDAKDNDFDGAATGSPMRWHDFDKDGYIRFDYDENLHGFPPIAGTIGHPLHRMLRPELYRTMTEFRAANPEIAIDTSSNSRVAQMEKSCKESIARVVPALTVEISDSLMVICDSTSSVLKASVTAPSRSDWIGGTFGIDEETLEGVDNDQDGLQDEDSRNLPGFDDDNDAVFTALEPYTVQPMQWDDGNGNGCIDIDASNDMGREGCIGTLEHRLLLARTLPDSLTEWYSLQSAGGNAEEAFQECLDDLQRAGLHTVGTQAQRDLACSVKHIWIATRPTASEWTGGTFGVDEERLDGIDNDGDGWVDEDLNEVQP